MSGGGDPVGGGVHATDDRRGTRLPGASEGTGSVQGVQGGDGGGIIGGAQYDTAWASDRGDMDLENLGHRGKSRGRTARPSCPRETHRAARWRNPPVRAETRTAIRVNFMHWNVLDTVVILEEGKSPTHSAPNATCWYPVVHWTEGNLTPQSEPGERSGREGG